MASYSAVIDVRVAGLNDVQVLQERVATLEGLVKRLKPIPSIFDQRVKAEVKDVANGISNLVESFAKGGGRFSTTMAGLNQQLNAFRTVVGNAKVGSDEFNNALRAGEQASRKLTLAEVERLQALNKIYTSQQTQGRTQTKGVEEILNLGSKIPNSIAGLELYKTALQGVLDQVTIGTADFYALSNAIDAVDVKLKTAQGKAPEGPTSPIGGGVNFPGSPGAKAAQTKKAENMMLGAGFPLLFGGGPLEVAGGLIGGAIGGFGPQIIISAIAAKIADAVTKVSELGSALKALNMDTLTAGTIIVNENLSTTVRRLKEVGDAERARQAIGAAVQNQTGLMPEIVSGISDNVNILNNTWNQFLSAVTGTLAILGTPFIAVFQLILSGLTKIVQLVNMVASQIANWLKNLGPLLMKLPFMKDIINNILNGVTNISEEEGKRAAKLQAIADAQKLEINNNQKLLTLESQRTLGRNLGEKQVNLAIDNQLAKEKIRQEYDQKRRDLALEYSDLQSSAYKEAINNLNTLQMQKEKQEEIKNSLVAQGLEIEANTIRYDAAASAIEMQIKALDQSGQIASSRLSAESAINDLYGAQLQRQYELATTTEQRKNIAIEMFNQQVKAAEIEYKQALVNNELLVQKAALEARLVEIKYQQLAAEKQIAIAQAQSRGNTPEQIQQIVSSYDEGLKIQYSAVQNAYEQLAATKQIAQNQREVANAVRETKVIQAESALAQKLVSDEIGMSKSAADALANSYGQAAQELLRSKRDAGELEPILYRATEQTGMFQSAMSSVYIETSKVTGEIYKAVEAQKQLNALKTIPAGPTPTGGTPTKAAAGAYWKGGFKAFAAGGMVNKPTLGLIGEGGQPEYIVPESKAKNFAMNYLMGARGATALNGSAGGYAGPSSATVSIQTGPVMQMNGANYVTTGEMVQAVQAGVERTLALIAGDQNMRRSVGIY